MAKAKTWKRRNLTPERAAERYARRFAVGRRVALETLAEIRKHPMREI